MKGKKDIDYTKDDVLKDVYDCSMEIFCKGIYVKSDVHPCGWDFLNFEYIDKDEDILQYKFTTDDISDGCYTNHPFEGLTLKEILIKVGQNFAFEKQNMDW